MIDMQKLVRLALAISICCLIAITFIPTEAAYIEQKKLPIVQESADGLKLKTTVTITSVNVEVSFPKPTLNLNSEHHTVAMTGLQKTGAPGEPVLPFKTVKILIPYGKEPTNMDVSTGNRRLIPGDFLIEYGKTPVPISSEPTKIDKPNPEIYNSLNAFPKTLYSQVMEQYLRGYRILLVTIHPIQYIPLNGQLYYFETMTVMIDLATSNETTPLYRNLPQDRQIVKDAVDNPQTAETYTESMPRLGSRSVDPSGSYDYVIITNANLNTSFQPLIASKIAKGYNATTVLVDDITSDPDYFADGAFGDGVGSEFNDTAAQIRNFIKDAYQNWETEYILLGGDTPIIPSRGVYGYVTTDPPTMDKNMPCDLYYGALDGSWDNDNDTVFGEPLYTTDTGSPYNGTAGDEADFYAEVYVGRATVTTQQQAQNFVNKTLWYEAATDDSYFKKAVMIGETLDEETEAGNSKDMVVDYIPQYTVTRLYQRDGTYSGGAVKAAINNGVHILNHDGHTNEAVMMDLDRNEVDTQIINTEYFFGYSVGCYAAALDLDAVMEHFITSQYGAFAFVGNSRYGWYSPGTTFGSGDKFDREFFNVINNTVQNLGKALQLSKEGFAGSIGSLRWTYYELNLLGDPEIELVTEIAAPTAHFTTNPTADNLNPPIMKGEVILNGTASKGTALGATFSNYTVEFGRGQNPAAWESTGITLVDNGQNETILGPLATWDTSLVAPGICTLRLTVEDAVGATGEDRWVVDVKEMTAIRVSPDLVETQEGLDFNVSFRITKPLDLYKLNFTISWNTTYLDYVSHEVYIPRNTNPGGILWQPISIPTNVVDEPNGTYSIAANSRDPALPFNIDGTVFNMTFYAKTNGTCQLKIVSSELNDYMGDPIAHNTYGGTVDIAPGTHDAAVASIVPIKTIVGEGYSTKIEVTIANEGTFSDNINFTVYANGTAINTTQIIVPGQDQATIGIMWSTMGWAKGNYTISVNITAIPGETDLLDNTMTDGEVCVTTPGDVDGDGDVDIFDIVKIAGAYGTSEGQPKYIGDADIDGDGDVDIFDVVIAAGYYGT